MADPQTTVKRNLLAWSAGTAMFCKYCQRVLDARNAVLLEARRHDGTQLFDKVLCCDCYDKNAPYIAKLFDGHTEAVLDVTDGRVLFAKPSKTRNPGTKPRVQRRKKAGSV